MAYTRSRSMHRVSFQLTWNIQQDFSVKFSCCWRPETRRWRLLKWTIQCNVLTIIIKTGECWRQSCISLKSFRKSWCNYNPEWGKTWQTIHSLLTTDYWLLSRADMTSSVITYWSQPTNITSLFLHAVLLISLFHQYLSSEKPSKEGWRWVQ